MTKPKVTPLLAIVVLSASTPAVAERVKPRRLPSGSPACANVLDKVFSMQDPAYQRCLDGYPDDRGSVKLFRG